MQKLMSTFELFQAEEFENLKWRWAFLASIIGNVVNMLWWWALRLR